MTPIERMKSHLDLNVDCRRKAIAVRRSHNPMVVRIGVKGNPLHPGTPMDIEDALYDSIKRLSKLGLKLSRGEVKENTVKKAVAGFNALLRKTKASFVRMKTCHESVEHWEGAIQARQIDIDIVELDNARLRRAS